VTAETRVVRLTIPAKAEFITLSRLALAGLAQAQPFAEEALQDAKLALTEACTNSVRHAYEQADEGQVEVVYELDPDRLTIEVCDDGDGFEAEEAADVEEMSESGLGLAIIRSLADEPLEIARTEGKGSRLRFVKHLGAA
jgi:serine/threonine-protein kinase RsbW